MTPTMSVIGRLSALVGVKRCLPISASVQHSPGLRCFSSSIRNKRERDFTIDLNPKFPPKEECGKIAPEYKNWVSYGFSIHDIEQDRSIMHIVFFSTITLVFVFGGFLLAYRPDDLGRDWAQREGYLELRRRENLGLPLIDPNYLPLDQIQLPTDEELGDTEIII